MQIGFIYIQIIWTSGAMPDGILVPVITLFLHLLFLSVTFSHFPFQLGNTPNWFQLPPSVERASKLYRSLYRRFISLKRYLFVTRVYRCVGNGIRLNTRFSCSNLHCKSIGSKAVSLPRHLVMEAYRGLRVSSTYYAPRHHIKGEWPTAHSGRFSPWERSLTN
jgi:hypothetical protein